jgi:hypothetical protein
MKGGPRLLQTLRPAWEPLMQQEIPVSPAIDSCERSLRRVTRPAQPPRCSTCSRRSFRGSQIATNWTSGSGSIQPRSNSPRLPIPIAPSVDPLARGDRASPAQRGRGDDGRHHHRRACRRCRLETLPSRRAGRGLLAGRSRSTHLVASVESSPGNAQRYARQTSCSRTENQTFHMSHPSNGRREPTTHSVTSRRKRSHWGSTRFPVIERSGNCREDNLGLMMEPPAGWQHFRLSHSPTQGPTEIKFALHPRRWLEQVRINAGRKC